VTGFVTALREGVLVCDGAMGTMLHAAGNSLDRALPELNLTNAELVSTVHESYLSAGVDVIQTNTFGASALRLAEQGSAGPVREINLAGVRIAREAQDKAGRQVFVGGSVSPAVTARQRSLISPVQRVAALREQVSALAEGGVDVLILETFGYLDELVEAVATAAELTGAPIIAQATFTPDGRTLGGETSREVASTLSGLPVAALGTNCTLGPQHTLTVVAELVRHTSLPVSAQPNAGLPRRATGRRFEYPIDGGYFARYARRYAEAGASLIGGCCGTTPTHLKAAVAAIAAQRLPRSRRGAAPAAVLADRPATATAEEGSLAERLAAGRFVVAAEIAPPVGRAGDEAVDTVAALRDRGLGAFLVSPQQTTQAHLGSLNLSLQLRQRLGADAIATITTWDKTIMALQADLLGAHALGLRAVVCATGNPPLRGDYPNVDGIWEVDSVGLAGLLHGLNQGRDSNGLALATKTSFHIGARFNPGAQDAAAEVARTREKLRAGAEFLITRPVYELGAFRRMAAELDPGVPVLLALAPLRGFDEAEYLAHEVPGITIPDATLRALERAGADAAAVGLDLAARLAAEAATLAQGVVLRYEGDLAAMDRLCAALSAGRLGGAAGPEPALGGAAGPESTWGGAAGPE
jgi:methionine synthase I (cobalamin-dependent)/5,10-methylenetetrahydrofolate reductase